MIFEWLTAQIILMILWAGVCGLGLLVLRIMTGGWGDMQTNIHMAELKREKEKEDDDNNS